MRKLILTLSNIAVVRKIVKALNLHGLGNWWLRHFPVVKTLPESDVRYRARRLDSLAMSVEMFDECILYPPSEMPKQVRTFADLGCNVGYFLCWLSHEAKSNQLKGLMVDANEETLEDARWHAEVNGLRNVHVLHGLVGNGDSADEADFFLHISNICSSATPPPETAASSTWTRKKVPCVSVEKNWRRLFGDEPCDLLKVDIEGAEMDFFKTETPFLRQVQIIIVEWHKWRVSLDEIKAFLGEQGFSLKTVVGENHELGTAFFFRK
jgi:FkbM family methyltransferase